METKEILDEIGMRRSMTRIAHEIIEHNKGVNDVVFVGIKTRGEILANRLCDMIEHIEDCKVPCYALDVSHWRDDLEEAYPIPDLEMPVKGKKVVLVDDVLFKGRTVRAAMDAIMHFGRASEIQLAVLVDRGHRELPIRADYIGKNIPSSLQEVIRVKVKEIDQQDGVYISK
ncbi:MULTISPECIES: bifunctional pyr operon transcriptional regulator/uracil phosphoribosyltransferase PyrR [Bacillota]|jgi:pyrimidine operon attenuation protein/uracil phosphoribosyltransferase|uniref:Bifunctional protein PyrR n=1 Tax=Amedibacillus hominis TaxID=2897776 RepID=A0ABS9R859_9FIRM|nr:MULTISPECIES: bifunctional pyr operon transcriptional regulator/uracil phosphoribosyltransferase PyrR [Bacillota]MCH4284969.1 bifunctional pyr operon transcriptional regulator/uracil phosphoribosyltransferase PyrR [Amedibacillus hominis]RGB55190.1 bifunctional pyr operon transcriptional regulator/uracil phosphoribosyltransferase PyrR [Absiella sp. AM22-9]RGB62819.1 bifunctional pyr operon transcriptional regulator/uracil phosphoribosyltransferase PyrR [Absiella sp. AM10-20]RGB63034.1 bifunct